MKEQTESKRETAFAEGSEEIEMKKFKVIVCCQGQPFEYEYRGLISALFGYAYHYLKKHRYGTMNFTLKEVE